MSTLKESQRSEINSINSTVLELTDYIHKGSSGCSSPVGMGAADENVIEMGNPECYLYPSLIAHELMHSLGFWHTQQLPNRDDYVTVEVLRLRNDAMNYYLANYKKIINDVSRPIEK